jgi:hypothetical protein
LVDILVYDLRLAISLLVVHCRKLDLNSDDTAELIPKGGYKLYSSIRYNRFRSVSESVYLLGKEFSYTTSVDIFIIRYRYRVLSESIDKHEYTVVAMLVFREILKIYTQVLHRVIGYR